MRRRDSDILLVVFWCWVLSLPALLLALLSLRGERRRAEFVARRLAETPEDLPPATVIVPVKGEDEGLRENLAALAALDYPDYELLIVARAAADIPPGVLPDRAKIVLAQGQNTDTSEKVQNLAAAVRVARSRSRILAFADSDGRVPARWLRALAAPLADPGIGASTGYRWFTPEPPTFWSLARSVWDAVAFGLLGPGTVPFAWGGAMAIRKETFFEARIPERWKGAISDDYTLYAGVRALGLKVVWAPAALVPSFDRLPASACLAWMRRQMMITRAYAPRLWTSAVAAHVVYCAGMAASIAASIQGHRLAEWLLIAQISPGMLKGLNRATIAKALLPERDAWFRRHAWVHALWVPAITWLWLAALVSSAFGNTIVWRGYRNQLNRRL